MKTLLLIALLVPTLTLAEITPPQGVLDPRIRVVDYSPLNVIKLVTFFGVSTHVQFAEGETIKDVAIGDDLAWKVISRGNHLFLNVTVVTDKRTYQFALVVQARPVKDSTAWLDPNLVYSLSFNYPDDEAAKLAASSKKDALKAALKEVKTKLSDASKEGQNFDYWVAGSDEISPTSARDDGRFIFLTFSNNRDMPAVYSVDNAGNEALINTNVIDGNTIVVQRLVAKLILRKGSAVASVVNKSFNLDSGIDNTSGTVAPDVERVIKGAQ
jgi:type IV secretion system protein VirB9